MLSGYNRVAVVHDERDPAEICQLIGLTDKPNGRELDPMRRIVFVAVVIIPSNL